MLFINVFLIVIHLMTRIWSIKSVSFCDERLVDSAFTFKNNTFLIRNNSVWIFDIKTNLVSSQSLPLYKLFKDHRIKSVDSIFVSPTNETIFPIVYIFSNEKYFLLKPVMSSNAFLVEFIPLVSHDEDHIPLKWFGTGDKPLDSLLLNNSIWFPSNIQEAVVLKEIELYLFHGSSIRYTMITNLWPQGRQIDYPFGGPLENLLKIDAVFRASDDELNESLVIVYQLKYCRFKRTQTNITIDIIESCKWKDSHEFFRCETHFTTKTTRPNSSKTTQVTNQNLNPQQNDSLSLVIIILFIGFFVFITSIIICLIIYHGNKRSYKTELDSNQFSRISQHDSNASLITINSKTGERVEETNSISGNTMRSIN